jgi:hypothetical protein
MSSLKSEGPLTKEVPIGVETWTDYLVRHKSI